MVWLNICSEGVRLVNVIWYASVKCWTAAAEAEEAQELDADGAAAAAARDDGAAAEGARHVIYCC